MTHETLLSFPPLAAGAVVVAALAMLIAAPKTVDRREVFLDAVVTTLATVLFLASTNPILRGGAWALGVVPAFLRRRPGTVAFAWTQLFSLAGFLLGAAVPVTRPVAWGAAAALKLGLFPFHEPLFRATEQGRASLAIMATASAPMGLMLLSSINAGSAGTYVAGYLLASAVLFAITAVSAESPRLLVATVAAFGYAVAAATFFSTTGEPQAAGAAVTALISLCSSGLMLVVWLLEERIGLTTVRGFQGLGAKAPVLGGTFLFFTLAAAGLPGTLGYVAEDLWLGVLFGGRVNSGFLPLVGAAIAACALFRAYTHIFLGPIRKDLPLFDLSHRERLGLALVALAVLAPGFFNF